MFTMVCINMFATLNKNLTLELRQVKLNGND